jgi:hypothetical protein
MTERNRNENPPKRGQQQQSQRDSTRHDDELNDIGRGTDQEPQRDRASVADDRGVDSGRRSFSGDRERDELGSEMEDDLGTDDGEADDVTGPEKNER